VYLISSRFVSRIKNFGYKWIYFSSRKKLVALANAAIKMGNTNVFDDIDNILYIYYIFTYIVSEQLYTQSLCYVKQMHCILKGSKHSAITASAL